MKFSMHHIHLKSESPKDAAQWYVDHFDAEIVGEGTLTGALTVRTNVGGVLVNITQASPQELPAGSSEPHMGLEHFGLQTDDISGALAELKSRGVRTLEEERTLPNGLRIAYVEAPDNVRVELVQSP